MATKKKKKRAGKARRTRKVNRTRVSSLTRGRRVKASAKKRRPAVRRKPRRKPVRGARGFWAGGELRQKRRNPRRRLRKITISDRRVAQGVVKALRRMGVKAKLG